MAEAKTPVHILSGFLGSGKTTFLNRILQLPGLSETLVIVNEFGDVALDHLLIEKSSDTIIELSNGCLCCSIRGELIETLQQVIDTPCRRIIIETTGVADPLPIMQAIGAHPALRAAMTLAPSLVVYDLVRGEKILEENTDAQKQLALADIVLLSKGDLVPPDAKAAIIDRACKKISRVNAFAMCLELPGALHQLPALLDRPVMPSLPVPVTQTSQDHSGVYKSISLRTRIPLPASSINRFLERVLHQFGEKVLRIKGLVLTRENPDQPLVVQLCGPLIHEPRYLMAWPQPAPETVLVVIVRDMDPAKITRLFDVFTGKPMIDTPDYDAVEQNPLATPGFNP